MEKEEATERMSSKISINIWNIITQYLTSKAQLKLRIHSKSIASAVKLNILNTKKLLKERLTECQKELEMLPGKEELATACEKYKIFIEGRAKTVTARELQFVTSLSSPPTAVFSCLEPFCILFKRKTNWKEERAMLKDRNFIKNLINFSRDLTKEEFRKLGNIIENDNFTPENIIRTSQSCGILCEWIILLYNYKINTQDNPIIPLEEEILEITRRVELLDHIE